MNVFQYIGLTFFGLLIVMNVRGLLRGHSSRRPSLAWLCVWVAGAISILAPDEMTRVARTLGINRGADLLLYTSVLSGLVISFLIYTRMRDTDRQITLIVRQIALDNAKRPDGFDSEGRELFERFDVEDPFFVEDRSA